MIYFVENWHSKIPFLDVGGPVPAIKIRSHIKNYIKIAGWAELFSFELCSKRVGLYDSAEHCGTQFFPVFTACWMPKIETDRTNSLDKL